jgi:hypothetical protein
MTTLKFPEIIVRRWGRKGVETTIDTVVLLPVLPLRVSAVTCCLFVEIFIHTCKYKQAKINSSKIYIIVKKFIISFIQN